MDHYVTGAAIRALREKQGMTQAELAEKLCVSDKAVSKWETGRGFPDVSLLEPLGKALRISIPESLDYDELFDAVCRRMQRTAARRRLLRSFHWLAPHPGPFGCGRYPAAPLCYASAGKTGKTSVSMKSTPSAAQRFASVASLTVKQLTRRLLL